MELLELLGLIELKHPQLSLPAVEALLAELLLSAYILYRFITALCASRRMRILVSVVYRFLFIFWVLSRRPD